jgi:hypothetical protein
LGVYFYRRRRHKYNTRVLQANLVFDNDVFAKPASSHEFDKYAMVDLMMLNSGSTRPPLRHHESSSTSTFDSSIIGRSTLSPVRYHESSSQSRFDVNNIGCQPQKINSFLDITNTDEDEISTTPTLAFPKPLSQKKRAPRGKPTWLSPIKTKEEARPPTYSMLSVRRETSIPIIPQGPRPRRPPKTQTIPMSPISPAIRQSYASLKTKRSHQSLVIPDFEVLSVVSPVRSESFAPKDLVLPPLPTPAQSIFGINSERSQIGFSSVKHDTDMELPRLMNVVALFTPNRPDELHISIGDAVRIIEEYVDGWCFVQFLDKKATSKGMVPLVCLQERKGSQQSGTGRQTSH